MRTLNALLYYAWEAAHFHVCIAFLRTSFYSNLYLFLLFFFILIFIFSCSTWYMYEFSANIYRLFSKRSVNLYHCIAHVFQRSKWIAFVDISYRCQFWLFGWLYLDLHVKRIIKVNHIYANWTFNQKYTRIKTICCKYSVHQKK